MLLLEHMSALPRLRREALREDLENIVLVVHHLELEEIGALMSRLPGARLRRIALWDLGLKRCMDWAGVPVCGLDAVTPDPELEFVCYFAERNRYARDAILRLLAAKGVERVHLLFQAGKRPPAYPPELDFYRKHGARLEAVYQELADEESRRVYAAAVKAWMSGDPAYLPLSPCEAYYHPSVRPEKGDHMIDGGVSDLVASQVMFAESVGTGGAIFGFEPIPYMCESAANTLSVYPQYRMFCQGLGERKEKRFFIEHRDGSSMTDQAQGNLECDMTSIDAFMAEHKIRRLDCIKLDVERCEAAVLRGAAETIEKFRPKLIVCLYHQPEDLMDLPEYVRTLVPEYRIHIAHHSYDLLDTVMYARVPG